MEELNQAKSKCLFDDLNGDFFLQKVFNNLPKKILFNVPRYNKKIQNRLNITFKDHTDYHEPIEIEIIPIKGKDGEFIRIKHEDNQYYHIYFNDGKEEIKRNNINKDENVRKIKIIIDYQVISFERLFSNCSCI